MKKLILAFLSIIIIAYQFSFYQTYWVKDELVYFSPAVANIYWISAGVSGVLLGTYSVLKYKNRDAVFILTMVPLFTGFLILGLFALATFITSM